MRHFIINFKNIDFLGFKAHGGGDFALRLVDYLILNKISFSIINNKTGLYEEYEDKMKDNFQQNEIIYFDPLYTGIDDNSYKYAKKYLFIHGLRMLEMPFDQYSYKYYKFPLNVVNYLKFKMLNNYYRLNAAKVLQSVKSQNGKVTVLTPSEHSKYIFKVQKNFNLDVKDLPPFLNNSLSLKEVELPFSEPYILFLNADRWVKNAYRFLKAYDELVQENKIRGVKLLLVGKPIFADEFVNHTVFINYVERSELEGLMKNCLFLAYPSLNEGFGYPPIDCMKYGKPTLCSAVSAPNIVCNGDVLFTSPFSIDEIKSRILLMLDKIDAGEFRGLEEKYNIIKNDIERKWAAILS